MGEEEGRETLEMMLEGCEKLLCVLDFDFPLGDAYDMYCQILSGRGSAMADPFVKKK